MRPNISNLHFQILSFNKTMKTIENHDVLSPGQYEVHVAASKEALCKRMKRYDPVARAILMDHALRYASCKKPTMELLYQQCWAAFEAHNRQLHMCHRDLRRGYMIRMPSRSTFRRILGLMGRFHVFLAREGMAPAFPRSAIGRSDLRH